MHIMTLVDDIADEHPTTAVNGEQPLMGDSPSILADVLSPIEGDGHRGYWCNGCFNVSLLRYDIL